MAGIPIMDTLTDECRLHRGESRCFIANPELYVLWNSRKMPTNNVDYPTEQKSTNVLIYCALTLFVYATMTERSNN